MHLDSFNFMIFAARTKLETLILENIDFYSELVIVNPVVASSVHLRLNEQKIIKAQIVVARAV